MHPLRNITLNDHLFKKYTKYHPFFCSAGGEGITHFFFSLKRGPIARKIITPHMSYSFLGKQAFEQVCENKWEKTKKIYERNPDNAVKILATLSYRGNFVGYDTSWDPRAFSLKQYETEKRWKSEEEKTM